MVRYRCDGCGREMDKGELRYVVKIDVRAAYDELEIGLADLVRDHRAEMLRLIEKMRSSGKSEQEIEETVYKSFTLDLCPACQRSYICDPLRFEPTCPPADTAEAGEGRPVDIDGFLRSLGFGGPGEARPEPGEN